MEYMDVLDGSGNPTGGVKSRDQIHKDGDWHKSVHGWIVNSRGDLLMQKRSPLKQANPGKWSVSFAGHVSAGDPAVESLIREAQEELGLTLHPQDLAYIATAKKQDVLNEGAYIDNGFNEVYVLRADIDPAALVLQADEVSEVAYIPFREVEARVAKEDPGFVKHPEEYTELFRYLHDAFPV